jgi:glucokinase
VLHSLLPSHVRTPEIVTSATSDGGTELCCETVRVFVEVLADVTQNFALSFMATGGIYIAGGLPLALRPSPVNGFEGVYSRSRRGRALTVNAPVHLVTKPYPVLHGAYCCALHKLGSTE